MPAVWPGSLRPGCSLPWASPPAARPPHRPNRRRWSNRPHGKLAIRILARTAMARLDPRGIMAQEQRYLDTLRQATTARVYGMRLWLETPDGRALVFAPNQYGRQPRDTRRLRGYT